MNFADPPKPISLFNWNLNSREMGKAIIWLYLLAILMGLVA